MVDFVPEIDLPGGLLGGGCLSNLLRLLLLLELLLLQLPLLLGLQDLVVDKRGVQFDEVDIGLDVVLEGEAAEEDDLGAAPKR